MVWIVPIAILSAFLSCDNSQKPSEIQRRPKPFCAKKPTGEILTCLKSQIATFKPEPLAYEDLINLIEERQVTEHDAIGLVKYGYEERIGNPILYLKAREEIKANHYSINLLWMHQEALHASGHLMGQNDQLLARHVINPLNDWQSKQPDASLNFWYDGKLVPSTNILETVKRLQLSGLDLKTIRMRDIRDLPYVQKKVGLFDTTLPIYFRVDLAKAVIADDVLRNEHLPFVVTTDSDVAAIVKTQLFDDPTLTALKNVGYAFGSAGAAEEENSFIMLHNSNELTTLDIHKSVVIDAAVLKTESNGYDKSNAQAQAVFSQYSIFRSAMRKAFQNKNGQTWSSLNIQKTGKFMIFPPSQFGVLGGYPDNEIPSLKRALISASEQARALMAK